MKIAAARIGSSLIFYAAGCVCIALGALIAVVRIQSIGLSLLSLGIGFVAWGVIVSLLRRIERRLMDIEAALKKVELEPDDYDGSNG